MKTKQLFNTAIVLLLSSMCIMCKKEDTTLGCKGKVGLEENYMDYDTEGGTHTFKIDNDIWWVSAMRTIVGNDTLNPRTDSITFPLKGDWYTIEKATHAITISVDKNESTNSRQLVVGLQSMNCFDAIWVEQTGKKTE